MSNSGPRKKARKISLRTFLAQGGEIRRLAPEKRISRTNMDRRKALIAKRTAKKKKKKTKKTTKKAATSGKLRRPRFETRPSSRK